MGKRTGGIILVEIRHAAENVKLKLQFPGFVLNDLHRFDEFGHSCVCPSGNHNYKDT